MKANMKLSPWIPLIFVLIVIAFLIQGFSALDVVMILGGIIIVGYFVLGYVRRKDALVIDVEKIIVKTPIKVHEFEIQHISEIYFKERDGSVLKIKYEDEELTLCSDIYDVSINSIKEYIIKNYPHIIEKVIETTKK